MAKTEKSKGKKSAKKFEIFKRFKKNRKEPSEQELTNIPPSWVLLWDSIKLYVKNFKVLGLMTLIYVFMYYVFIYDSAASSVNDFIGEYNLANGNRLANRTLAGLSALIDNNQYNETSNLIRGALFIFFSLAFIWAIRRMVAKEKFDFRDPFYKGMYPLIPFIVLTLILTLQMVPFFLGAVVYSFVAFSEVVRGFVEQLPFIIFWIFGTYLSARWLTTSIMAVYAVTLPDMYPIQAIRAVKRNIIGRRIIVFRRIVIFGFIYFVTLVAVFLFSVWKLPSQTTYVMDIAPVVLMPLVHAYLFKLYKSLILDS